MKHYSFFQIIKNQIKKITLAELNKNSDWDVKTIIKNINSFLWIEAIDTKVEIDDVEAIVNIELSEIEKGERLSEYIYKIAEEELEKLIENARDKKEFYDLEKRIMLQSIDELWMEHIDSMTKLREEVAFEWYAQRQPLVVYKEKAFEKFENLLWEIEFKITKAIFSINAVVEDTNVSNVENDEKDLVWLLDNLLKEESSNSNPFFANPNDAKKESNKKKIRV